MSSPEETLIKNSVTTLKTSLQEIKREIKKNVKEKKNTNSEPLIYIRQISFLSESIINYFAIGICLIIYGFQGLKWFNINNEIYKQFYLGYFFVSGTVLYIMGILNWYEGRNLIFILDFIFSFLFIALFLKNQHIFGYISDFGTYNDNLEGIFYIFLFCFIVIIGISAKEKGVAFIINCCALFVSYLFLFVYKFCKNNIIGKIDCYLFIFSGVLFWITGLFKLFTNLMNYSTIFFELYH